MLQEALTNQEIKTELARIAARLRTEILSVIIQQEHEGKKPKLTSIAMQHSTGDRFVGALLPEYTQDYLEKTIEGRQKLLNAIDECLKNAVNIQFTHEFLALMKCFDGMAFMYDVFETEKYNPNHMLRKDYIAPTKEETEIRKHRLEPLLATTYGIGVQQGVDLVKQTNFGCVSGKARFFINPIEGRKPIWFEQLADQSKINKPKLPLIATASNAAAKNFMMAHGMELFKQEDGLFNFKSAQIFANCFMAYLVYCGHHSFLEVIEIWNRQLDYLVIEKPEQLSKNLTHMEHSDKPYMEEEAALERKLPYAIIGDYESFLHSSYAKQVIQRAEKQVEAGLDLSFEHATTTHSAMMN